LALEADLEGHHRVRSLDAVDGLEVVVDDVLQVAVVDRIQLDHEVVATHDADATDDLRYSLHGLDHAGDLLGFPNHDEVEGAGVVPDMLRRDEPDGPGENAHFLELADPLVDERVGRADLVGQGGKGGAAVGHQGLEDADVGAVNLVFGEGFHGGVKSVYKIYKVYQV